MALSLGIDANNIPRNVKAAHAIAFIDDTSKGSWNLSDDQIANLLGMNKVDYRNSVASSKIYGSFELDDEQYSRCSIVLGIYKGLRLIEPNDASTNFFVQPNSAFDGKSFRDIIINSPTLPNLMKIRRYLNAIRA